MAAIILPFPTATNVRQHYRRDADGDGDGRQPQRRRERDIIVPGEIVTDDAQWMR